MIDSLTILPIARRSRFQVEYGLEMRREMEWWRRKHFVEEIVDGSSLLVVVPSPFYRGSEGYKVYGGSSNVNEAWVLWWKLLGLIWRSHRHMVWPDATVSLVVKSSCVFLRCLINFGNSQSSDAFHIWFERTRMSPRGGWIGDLKLLRFRLE